MFRNWFTTPKADIPVYPPETDPYVYLSFLSQNTTFVEISQKLPVMHKPAAVMFIHLNGANSLILKNLSNGFGKLISQINEGKLGKTPHFFATGYAPPSIWFNLGIKMTCGGISNFGIFADEQRYHCANLFDYPVPGYEQQSHLKRVDPPNLSCTDKATGIWLYYEGKNSDPDFVEKQMTEIKELLGYEPIRMTYGVNFSFRPETRQFILDTVNDPKFGDDLVIFVDKNAPPTLSCAFGFSINNNKYKNVRFCDNVDGKYKFRETYYD